MSGKFYQVFRTSTSEWMVNSSLIPTIEDAAEVVNIVEAIVVVLTGDSEAAGEGISLSSKMMRKKKKMRWVLKTWLMKSSALKITLIQFLRNHKPHRVLSIQIVKMAMGEAKETMINLVHGIWNAQKRIAGIITLHLRKNHLHMNRSMAINTKRLLPFLPKMYNLPLVYLARIPSHLQIIIHNMDIRTVCLILDIIQLSSQSPCHSIILHHMCTHLAPILLGCLFHLLINLLKTNWVFL